MRKKAFAKLISILIIGILSPVSGGTAFADTPEQISWMKLCIGKFKPTPTPAHCQCVKVTLSTRDLHYYSKITEIYFSNESPALKDYQSMALLREWEGGNMLGAQAHLQTVVEVVRECGVK